MWPCLSVRGAGDRPDSAITAARESARRKNKSFAQYTGVLSSGRPYRLGLEPAFFAPAGRMRHPQGVRDDSLLERYLNTSNLTGTRPSGNRRRAWNFDGKAELAGYSAASACNELGFAAETMKSWMRGTISDLKREPLNTP